MSTMKLYHIPGSRYSSSFTKDLFNPNKPLWVKITDKNNPRFGAIGRVVPTAVFGKPASEWAKEEQDYLARVRSKILYRAGTQFLPPLSVDFGKGRKLHNPYGLTSMCEWLIDYTGTYEWHFKRKEKPAPVQAFDRLGLPLVVGDMVVYSKKEYHKIGNTVFFGVITKITSTGACYCRNIKISEKDSTHTTRLQQSHSLMKMHKDIFKELMIQKLTY